MMQLISVITSLAYVGVGGVKWKTKPPVSIALVLLGIASFLFHAIGLHWAQAADEIAMYLVFTAFIGWEISKDNTFTGIFMVLLTLLTGLFFDRFDSHAMVPFLFLVLFLIRGWKRRSLWFALAFAIGGVFWIVGMHNPMFGDLLHGIWHVCTSYGFYLL